MSISGRPTPSPPPPSPPFDLELTILSGKHLKNVNWKNGDLKPYAIFWVDPDHKLTTKSDDSGNTKPIWNQKFILPITVSLPESSLSLEIFHSKTSETPKPFVGSLQVRLADLPDPTNHSLVRSFDLRRPSGRVQGKIRLKISIKEHPLPPPPPTVSPSVPDYQNAPHYYYSSAPPYPYAHSGSGSRPGGVGVGPTTSTAPAYPYSMGGYYSGYYPPPPPMPRPFSDRYGVGVGAGAGAPSAPVEYANRSGGGGFGLGTGLAVGAVAGALGGMALDEGLRHEEGRVAERVEDNLGARDDYSDYRADF